jgi:hypothetical protein
MHFFPHVIKLASLALCQLIVVLSDFLTGYGATESCLGDPQSSQLCASATQEYEEAASPQLRSILAVTVVNYTARKGTRNLFLLSNFIL